MISQNVVCGIKVYFLLLWANMNSPRGLGKAPIKRSIIRPKCGHKFFISLIILEKIAPQRDCRILQLCKIFHNSSNLYL